MSLSFLEYGSGEVGQRRFFGYKKTTLWSVKYLINTTRAQSNGGKMYAESREITITRAAFAPMNTSPGMPPRPQKQTAPPGLHLTIDINIDPASMPDVTTT
jgi:hypothetical protein